MKKLVCTLTLISLVSAGIYAQGISGGLKAGVNFANQDISGDGISLDTKSKIGFHAGAFATIMFNEKMGLQPEILYSTQGSKIDIDGTDAQFNFDYVTVPILFRYNINEMFNLHAGPQLAFLTKAEIEQDGDTEDLKEEEVVKGTDFGGAIGAGVDLPMGVGFGARYIFAFGHVTEDTDAFPEIKNSNIQIFVSYKLFGKK